MVTPEQALPILDKLVATLEKLVTLLDKMVQAEIPP
jgi:hypothetical protein